MGWYVVTKRIRGRSYLYWQKTYRVGRSVKTLNKYIGPAGSHSNSYSLPPSQPYGTNDHDYAINENPDFTYSFSAADHTFQFTNFYDADHACTHLKHAVESGDDSEFRKQLTEVKRRSLWSNTSGDTYWKQAKRRK